MDFTIGFVPQNLFELEAIQANQGASLIINPLQVEHKNYQRTNINMNNNASISTFLREERKTISSSE